MILAQCLCPLNRMRRYHFAKSGLNPLPSLDYQSVACDLGEIAACFRFQKSPGIFPCGERNLV